MGKCFKAIGLFFFVLCCLFGCSGNRITKNFFIEQNENGTAELIYVDSSDRMFLVLKGNIVDYRLCGDNIILKSRPIEYGENLNENFFEFYTVDVKRDYSNDNNSPGISSEEAFDNCGSD